MITKDNIELNPSQFNTATMEYVRQLVQSVRTDVKIHNIIPYAANFPGASGLGSASDNVLYFGNLSSYGGSGATPMTISGYNEAGTLISISSFGSMQPLLFKRVVSADPSYGGVFTGWKIFLEDQVPVVPAPTPTVLDETASIVRLYYSPNTANSSGARRWQLFFNASDKVALIANGSTIGTYQNSDRNVGNSLEGGNQLNGIVEVDSYDTASSSRIRNYVRVDNASDLQIAPYQIATNVPQSWDTDRTFNAHIRRAPGETSVTLAVTIQTSADGVTYADASLSNPILNDAAPSTNVSASYDAANYIRLAIQVTDSNGNQSSFQFYHQIK